MVVGGRRVTPSGSVKTARKTTFPQPLQPGSLSSPGRALPWRLRRLLAARAASARPANGRRSRRLSPPRQRLCAARSPRQRPPQQPAPPAESRPGPPAGSERRAAEPPARAGVRGGSTGVSHQHVRGHSGLFPARFYALILFHGAEGRGPRLSE